MKCARGFSLLEILLALMLLALLMGGAFLGMRTITRSVERGESLIEKTNKLRVAQEFLRRQLAHTLAMPFEYARDTGEPTIFKGAEHELVFVAPMPGYLGQGGPYVQSLQFQDSNEHGMQLLFRHLLLNAYDPEDNALEQVEPVVLYENIGRAQFTYQGLDENGELEDWQSEWETSSQTPLLVKLQMDFEPQVRMEWPELIIALRINPFSGVNGRLGVIPPIFESGSSSRRNRAVSRQQGSSAAQQENGR